MPIIWGQNKTGLSGAAFSDAWNVNTVETLPSTAVKLGVSSSDNTKDTAAGVGARTVGIWYLDSNYAIQYETVTLTGQTEVDTTGTALRVIAAEVLTVGSELDPAGNIWIYDASDTVTAGVPQTATKQMGYIEAGENVMRKGSFTVPAGRTRRVLKVEIFQRDASATLRYGKARIQFRPYGGVWKTLNISSFTSDSPAVLDYMTHPQFAPTFSEKTDFRVQTTQLAPTPWGCQIVYEDW